MARHKNSRLTLINLESPRISGGRYRRYAKYKCDCGAICIKAVDAVTQGATRSCGCLHKETASKVNWRHGKWGHPLYSRWAQMLRRCNAKNSYNYRHYGARGIRVCSRWHSFPAFLEDMESSWSPGLTIDRINNDGHYEPSNCRWANQVTQTNNGRRNIMVVIDGKRKSLATWCREYNRCYRTVLSRIAVIKWPPQRAVLTPTRARWKDWKDRSGGPGFRKA